MVVTGKRKSLKGRLGRVGGGGGVDSEPGNSTWKRQSGSNSQGNNPDQRLTWCSAIGAIRTLARLRIG